MDHTRSTSTLLIGDQQVGPGHPVFIIAEAGVNHNGDPAMAKRLVDAAVEAGADAVKFQTFKADLIVTPQAPKAEYQIETTGNEESQLEMLQRLELGVEAHWDLKDHCRDRGILFMSTPADKPSADLLEDMDVALFKIGSGELTHLPFLAYVAQKNKPMIVSTGMGNLREVATAVETIRDNRPGKSDPDMILLQCVSNYPADPADVNLLAMGTMEREFQMPVGYSDHTLGTEVSLAAVAMGACVIEKHITLDRSLPGPDHRASLEPEDFAAMVRGIRTVESALGHGRKEPAASEANTAAVARKSLVAAEDIPAGAALTDEMIAVMRPGTGLTPAMIPQVLGRVARRDIPVGTLIDLEMLR